MGSWAVIMCSAFALLLHTRLLPCAAAAAAWDRRVHGPCRCPPQPEAQIHPRRE
uniref:Uncharacterized protein n=1 Tax=Setaria viridis TaxID=4556 RepID=A0A4U6TCD3_SETVI|nr:hypothetical protein SEVIR_8G062550v2 [Setaria viridis]